MKKTSINEIISGISRNTPDKTAIQYGNKNITYSELEKKSDDIADFLISKLDDVKNVFILMDRCPELIEGIIGIMKSQGIFIPMQPDLPENRIKAMFSEIESGWIVTTPKWLNKVNNVMKLKDKRVNALIIGTDTNKINYDEYGNVNIFTLNYNPSTGMADTEYIPNKHAYIYFTSGSTGKPKAILGRHRSLMQFIQWEIKEMGVDDTFKISQLTALSFDAFLRDVFVALCSGGTLCIPCSNEIISNPIKLIEWIENCEITLIHTVPSLFKILANEIDSNQRLNKLKYILLAGEMLRGNDVKKFIEMFGSRIQLVNFYGATETTLIKFFYRLSEKDVNKTIIPVGKPIDFAEALLLNSSQKLCPQGSVGEIYIRTPFITSGYCNDIEQTRKVFIKNPFTNNPKDIIYKTGDLGRILSDGNLEVIGRNDQQVKIRGIRIEPSEIENKLLEYKEISDAKVIDRNDKGGEKCLCAYLILKENIEIPELRRKLLSDFPEYMIPSYFVILEKFPLTPNGKLDRNALPDPDEKEAAGKEYVAPQTEIQKKLVRIWSEVLEVNKIGINDNFFQLGGHSLKAISIISKIYKEFNVEVSIMQIFSAPTIKELAEYIENSKPETYMSIEKTGDREFYPVSSAQRRLFLLNEVNDVNIAYNSSYVLQAEGKLDKEKFENAIRGLIDRHEALRTSFEVVEGKIVQKIHKTIEFNIDYAEAEEKDIDNVIRKYINPFDLTRAPLFKTVLIKLEAEKYIILFDMHHIISDGASNSILFREFISLYKGNKLPELRIQYKDYCVWQEDLLKSDKIKLQKKYWINEFKGDTSELNMPMDFKRQGRQTFNGSTISFTISNDILNKISLIAKNENMTLNMVLFSIYNILLSKYSGQEYITTGLITEGRNHPDLQNIIGIFINFLPVKSKIKSDSTIKEFLQQEKLTLENTYENQDYPFEEIVNDVALGNNNGRNPLFDTMFIMHNEVESNVKLNIDGLNLREYGFKRQASTLDFKMDALMGADGSLYCGLQYNTSLFKEESMKKFAEHFQLLISSISSNLDQHISDIEIFTDDERLQIEEKRKINENVIDKHTVIAVSSTFSDEPVGDYIKWWCKQFKENVVVKFAQYNQVFQQLLDPGSLISNNSGANILLIRFEDYIRNINGTDKEKCDMLEQNYRDLVDILKNKQKEVPYFVGLFPVSTHLSLSDAVIKYLEDVNTRWANELAEINNIYTIDFTDTDRLYEIKQVFDPERDEEGHLPFSEEYFAAMGTVIARNICSWKKQQFKVIALDCDNTLWKGICGEEGAKGVSISGPFAEFQKFLITQYEKGMLLTLCSKNNEADVWEVFDNNPDMLLKKEHFTAWRINWQSKSANLKELAAELNLGIDSFIFIDDSPMECSEVMTNCPEVLTLQLPEDAESIPNFLRHVWAFDKLKVTQEDRNRTKMYVAEKNRQELLGNAMSFGGFLQGLNLMVSMNSIKDEQIERAAQLTQRTNQFNLSTIRRTEQEILKLLSKKDMKCYCINVADRFGDYGLTGIIITEEVKDTLNIDTFLLSCRVLGRNVEDAVITGLKKYCMGKGLDRLEARFYPTKKNKPFLDFLKRTGWQSIEETNNYTRYSLPVKNISENIEFIKFYYESNYENSSQFTAEMVAATANSAAAVKEVQTKVYGSSEWNLNVVNEENLVHSNYLLPLKNHSAEMLLALPVRDIVNFENINEEYVTCSNKTEEMIVEIWSEVLSIDKRKIGVNYNFFDLGGNSINVLKITSKINTRFEVNISIGDVILNPTVKGLAESIKNETILNKLDCVIKLNKSTSKKNIFIIHGVDGEVYAYRNLAKLLQEDYNVYGVQSRAMARECDFPKTRKEMISYYLNEIKMVQKDGPYIIVGYCAGTRMSYDMVGMLEENGDVVEKFFLVDESAFFKPKIARKLIMKQTFTGVCKKIKAIIKKEEKEDRYLISEEELIPKVKANPGSKPYTPDKDKIKEFNEYITDQKGVYLPERIVNAPIYVIKPSRANPKIPHYDIESWRKIAKNKVSLTIAPGDHYSVWKYPDVLELGNVFKKLLKEKD